MSRHYVSFTSSTDSGQYSKLLQTSYRTDNITMEDITLRYKDLRDGKTKDEHLWLCSKYQGPRNQICVGFFHNREGRLMPKQLNAFCFFPTKEYTGLNFIIHAPFLLTDSRESIQAGVEHNNSLIRELAKLATQSFRSLRYRSKNEKTGTRIIDSNIFDLIPYERDHFSGEDSRERISFYPFFNAFVNLLKNHEIIPTLKGYTTVKNAYWADTPQTTSIFSDTQLQQLMKNQSAKWIDIGSGTTNCRTANYTLYNYLTYTIDITTVNEDQLIRNITSDFTRKQSIIWLLGFYKYLLTNKKRVDSVKFLPIFLDEDKEPAAAYIEDHGSEQAVLFLPADDITGFETIHPELASHKETLQLAKALDIAKPTLKNMIYNKILPQYEEDSIEGFGIHFAYFYTYYLSCSISEKQDFINLISDKAILYCHKFSDIGTEKDGFMVVPSSSYLPFDGMDIVFEHEPGSYIVDMDFYKDLNLSRPEHLREFLLDLGVKTGPTLTKYEIKAYEYYNGTLVFESEALKYAAPNTKWESGTRSVEWIVPSIPGVDRLLQRFTGEYNEKSSVFIWNTLIRIAEEHKFSTKPQAYDSFEHKLIGTYYYQLNALAPTMKEIIIFSAQPNASLSPQ